MKADAMKATTTQSGYFRTPRRKQPLCVRRATPLALKQTRVLSLTLTLSLPLILTLALTLTSCMNRTIQYEWTEHPVPPARRSNIFFVDPVPPLSVSPAASSEEKYVIASTPRYTYKSSNAVLTRALAEQLAHEFALSGGSVAPDAERGVVVEVKGAEAVTAPMRSTITLQIKFTLANGTMRELEVRNRTAATPGRAYDGAITLAALAILQHPDFFNYLADR
jgi:hypothetical protein